MQKATLRNWRPVDTLISFTVLGFLLLFTYGFLFKAPYSGFYFNTADGTILQIYKNENSADLRVNDILKSINSVTWEDYYEHKNLYFFEGVQPGQTIEIVVLRDGESITTSWVYAGFNPTEFLDRFFNIWWLAYIFWFFSIFTQLFMRPKDARWHLFIAANYLTGIFIILGTISAWHMWGSSALLHAVAWLILPVYIHFHWIFPTSLRSIPRWGWAVFYIAGFSLALGELFLPMPRTLYFFALLLAFGGGIFLLGLHFLLQPDHRRGVRLLAVAALFILFPVIGVSLVGSNGQLPQSAPLSLLVLPILPTAYFYAVYQRRLGGLELRANRLMSIYFFLILLGTALLLIVGYSGLLDISREALIFVIVLVALLTTILSILVFPVFQAFIERRVLGIKLPGQNLAETYSVRIITSATQPSLLKLLEEDVFPSLLVQQYAFVRITNPSAQIMLSKGVTQDQVPQEALAELIASSQAHSLPLLSNEDQPLGWVRIILPMKLGSNLIGAWLLGRRAPDDHYPQAELPILQSLANQTAIALSNILQTERLRKMYEDDIERNEKGRLQLALDLHDSVLNQLAILRLSVDDTHVSPNFQGAYDEVTRRLREIVTDLRPPMLSYGLKPAIEELADNLMERSKDAVNVVTDLHTEDETRYAENIEQHLYRIVQEACENAMRHAHAANIRISGTLNPQKTILKIEDDGAGFDAQLELTSLIADNHFGLAGMVERAHLIGAQINIQSSPNTGTRIEIAWADNAEKKLMY